MRDRAFDINGWLTRADLVGRRAACRVATRYRVRMRDTDNPQDSDIWDDFKSSLAQAMKLAYHAGEEAWSRAKPVAMAHDKAVRRILRGLPKYQKRAIDELYDKIAASATRSTRAKVRDRMIRGILNYDRGDYRGYMKRTRLAAKGEQASLETITRTQNAIAFNAAIWHQGDDENELWGWEYSTSGDERVRESHQVLDGVRYPRDHAFWNRYAPPNGWRCRCTLVPIYVGEPDAYIVAFHGTPDVPPEFRFNPGRLLTAA